MTIIKSNTTIKLTCQEHDILIRCSPKGLLENQSPPYKLVDFWEMRLGDRITITNKIEDFPSWFHIHPLEVRGEYMNWMEQRLNNGYKPVEPIVAPNLWRIFFGNVLAHIAATDLHENVTIYRFDSNALVVGEPGPYKINLKRFVFGCPDDKLEKETFNKRVHEALNSIYKLGPSDYLSTGKWAIG